MPVYLLYGFRWPRPLIRIHIILQNLEDAAAEWLVAPATSAAFLDNFDELFPDIMKHLPNLRFIEQYDPDDILPTSTSQPYAYVTNLVHEIRLGADVDELREQAPEFTPQLGLLRDKLSPEAKLGWYIVVCGDPERLVPSPTSTTKRASYDLPLGSTDIVDHGSATNTSSPRTTRSASIAGHHSRSTGAVVSPASAKTGTVRNSILETKQH